MFYNCSNASFKDFELPAEVLKPECYSYMFFGCHKMTVAPELKAIELDA
jgi:hypothetical protein